MRRLDDCVKPALDALQEARDIGNQRAGIVTDCSHCKKSLRIAVSVTPASKRGAFKCTVCGTRWIRSGKLLVRAS